MRVGQIIGKAFKEREQIEIDAFEVRKTEMTRYNKEQRRDVTLKRYQIARLRSVAPRAPRDLN